MPVDLEAFDATLDEQSRTLLGDTITYTPHGDAPATFKAIVDYGDQERTIGSSLAVAAEPAVEVPVSLVATVDPQDVIHLPRTGLDYVPKGPAKRDRSGRHWLILLKRKPA